MSRIKKELHLLSKEQVGKNSFTYIFQDKQGSKYIWITTKEYWFNKKDWWLFTFEIQESVNGNVYIKNCRMRGV